MDQKLKEIIKNSKSVFKVRSGSVGPAKVKQMKIILDLFKKLVKVKAGKYPT